MNLDLLVFFSFYFLAIFSVIGYGLFFANLTNFKSISQNQGFLGLVGLFFLTIYSYLSNFFYSHGVVHNSILLFVGLFLYFYLLDNKKKKDKNQTFITIIIFLILFIAILIFKTHDDFPYYHFAYSYYLTQSSSFIGLPTPASAIFIASLPIIINNYNTEFSIELLLSITATLSILLVSELPLFSLKIKSKEQIKSTKNIIRLLFLIKSIILLFILDWQLVKMIKIYKLIMVSK